MKEMMGNDSEWDTEEQTSIVSSASRLLTSRFGNKVTEAQEDDLLDALLHVFDETSRESTPTRIVVDDPDNFDQILSNLAQENLRTAGNTLNLTTGAEGEEYDKAARTYRRKGRGRKPKEEKEFLITDGAHKDPGFGPATEAKGTHRTRKDMLARE